MGGFFPRDMFDPFSPRVDILLGCAHGREEVDQIAPNSARNRHERMDGPIGIIGTDGSNGHEYDEKIDIGGDDIGKKRARIKEFNIWQVREECVSESPWHDPEQENDISNDIGNI